MVDLNLGMNIIAIIIGSLIVVLILIAIGWFFIRRPHKVGSDTMSDELEPEQNTAILREVHRNRKTASAYHQHSEPDTRFNF